MSQRILSISLLTLLLVAPAPAAAQHDSGGGDTGAGIIYGDLVVIERLPNGLPVYVFVEAIDDEGVLWSGWCVQPLDAAGQRIPLGADCDVPEEYIDSLVEVTFGRLNAARAKPHVGKMRFGEVINYIKAAHLVTEDEAGRLKLGFDCIHDGDTLVSCTWKVIDSPLENLALYTRLMNYGHIQSDPLEIVDSPSPGEEGGGDPAETRYQPALGPEDYAKFTPALRHLLPRDGMAASCWSGTPAVLDPGCLAPEAFDTGDQDFLRAASFLAGGADKDGLITVDLVQYFNRILGVTALHVGLIGPAPNDPSPDPDLYIDFGPFDYARSVSRNVQLAVLVSDGAIGFQPRVVPLLDWLSYRDPLPSPGTIVSNIAGFVQAANDALRTIEFVHEYAIPARLWPATTANYTTIPVIEQPSCTYHLTASLWHMGSEGGTGTLTVDTESYCDWMAVAGADWITFQGPRGMLGDGTVTFVIAPNSNTDPRSAAIVVADQSVTILQAGIDDLALDPALDLDRDGRMDLLWQHAVDGAAAVWSMDGVTRVSADLLADSAGPDWRLAGSGDVDLDGSPDIFWQNRNDAGVAVWLMDGLDRREGMIVGPPVLDTAWRVAGTGDMNGDGRLDLVWQNDQTGVLSAWLFDGTTFLEGLLLTPYQVPDTNWRIRGVGDLNGDGHPDLVWQHIGDGRVSAWFMYNMDLVEGGLLEPGEVTDLDMQISAVVDMNQDGRADLVWQHQTTGALSVWFMNGASRMLEMPLSPAAVTDLNWKIVSPR